MKKIAIIGFKDIDNIQGGIENHVNNVVQNLKTYSPILYYRGPKKSSKKYIKIHIPTVKTKYLETPIYSLFATIHAITQKPDAIHYHALGPAINLPLAKLFRIPTVVTIHGLDYQRKKWNKIAKIYLKICEKIILNYSDEIIVVSETLKKYYENKHNKKTTYLPNGVELKPHIAPDLITKKFGLHQEDYILYLGRLVPEKGIDLLITAYEELTTNKKLVIAGASSYAKKYTNELKKTKNPNILFTGFVDGQTKEELYANTDLFILPSYIEGLSISLITALSYGRKVLVSDIPENKELIKNFGTTFKTGDSKDLKNKLEKLIKNTDKNLDAINYIIQNYNWEKITKQTEQIYDKITK